MQVFFSNPANKLRCHKQLHGNENDSTSETNIGVAKTISNVNEKQTWRDAADANLMMMMMMTMMMMTTTMMMMMMMMDDDGDDDANMMLFIIIIIMINMYRWAK